MIYKGEYLNEISFPLGGIGSGSIGLAGNGRLIDWEIFNRPSKGSVNGYSHIAVKLIKNGKTYTKVLNSDINQELVGHFCDGRFYGYGFGPDSNTMAGLPHFKNCEFNGEFPIAQLKFTDNDFPGTVVLTAFNPFIPLDSKNSSIPAAFFQVTYENDDECDVEFRCAFVLANPFSAARNISVRNGNITSVKLINAAKSEDDVEYGDISVSCIDPKCVQKYWYRGRWKDGLSTYWNEFAYTDTLIDRTYRKYKGYVSTSEDELLDNDEEVFPEENFTDDHCVLLKGETIGAGKKADVRFVVSWNIPNQYNYWAEIDGKSADKTSWKNYYATIFNDSVESGVYSLQNWDEFYAKTKAFKDELFASTVDDVIKDAISGTISVLKSSTVFRLENGEFYGFEGVHEKSGSCEGTCQHVYNYAYAMCFLFPDLERSIRDLEFKHATYDDGGTIFRLQLPLGSIQPHGTSLESSSCVDGQMGCVIKTYREWKISGDDEWLRSVWPTVKKMLEYAWSDANSHEWDKDKDGVLEGRQHHTLDIEMFGPSSWLQGFYLAALKAASEMAQYLGYDAEAKEYIEIFEKGKKWTKENLFNGSYFIQKVNLTDKSIIDHYGCSEKYWNEETGEIKYQVGEGSSIDQLTGQWHANICGLGELFDKEQINTALSSMMKNNFKPSMREIANLWRIFALNDEAGTIMCDFPKGTYKPRIPITYCEECMTGFEYQFAGMLMSEGFKDDGIKVVKAIRDRYDGKKRNPWNEIECGSNYVRAMASYSLLPIISGFIFDLPNNRMGFNPIEDTDNFICIWSLGTGWGNVCINSKETIINIIDGSVELKRIDLPYMNEVTKLVIDGIELPFEAQGGIITFEKTKITDFISII